MAKVKSSGLRNYVGRLAGSIYYMDKGRNISREVAAQVSNPQTQAQMVQRVRLANLVNFYKVNKEWMLKYAFENLPGLQSVYNVFVSLNLTPTAVPLTKENAAAGVVMPDLMKVTKGSLPTIQQSIAPGEDKMKLTGIEMDPNNPTVGGLTDALVNNGWKIGDQLSIIRIAYISGEPCKVDAKEIILASDDTSRIGEYDLQVDQDGNISTPLDIVDPTTTRGFGGVFVHSRRVSGKVLVSSQTLNLDTAAMQAMFAGRSTRAYENAIASYGYTDEAFLDPANDDESLQGVRVYARPDDVVAGTVTGSGYYEPGTEVTLTATAYDGFTFVGWFINGNTPFASTATITITANANISLEARFERE